ncbi:MAG: sulfotransferase [Bacteroidota bacterium]
MKIAVDRVKNWVFVTGEIRGGTTFVGKILSLPLEVDYIHEPFNIRCGMPGMTKRWRYVKPSLDTPGMQEIHEAASRIFSYNFSLRNSPFENEAIHRRIIKQLVGTRGPYYLRLAKMNPFHRHAVIKDPTGTLLAEYLHVHFGVKPVIVIRHPASFVASLRRAGWWPDVRKILDGQPELVADHLNGSLDSWFNKDSDDLQNAAAHWRLLTQVVVNQAKKYDGWELVKLEDLSNNPVEEFKALYGRLGLPWSESVKKKIINTTQVKGKAEVKNNLVQDFKRDSAKIFELRRNSLTKEERRKIFDVVKDVALEFYSEESFSL